MNPDLLYRINYGPLTKKESNNVATFLRGQLSDIKARQYARTFASRSAQPWRSLSPFYRPSISPTIDCQGNVWPITTAKDPSDLALGCLDPRLGVELLCQLFPMSSDIIPGEGSREEDLRLHFQNTCGSFLYTPKDLEVDNSTSNCLMMFEHSLLNLCRRRYSRGDLMVFPLGALALDILEVIPKMKSSVESNGDFEKLTATSIKYLTSSFSYLSTAERGRSYWSSTTLRFIHTILFTEDSYYLQKWNKTDNVEEFFSRAFSGYNPRPRPQSFDQESARLDISNVDASYICSGPFRLMLTTRIEKHLHLDKDGILYIFWDFTQEIGSSLDIYKGHFLWDSTGELTKYFSRQHGFLISRTINKFQKELRLTHEILFMRSRSSRKLGEVLYGRSISSKSSRRGVFLFDDVTCVSLRDHLFDQTSSNISNFHFFGPRIVYLLQSMENWRARTFCEVFIPGYSDRRDWWVAMFAIFFGFITVLGLGLTAYQTYLAQRQVALALEALNPTPHG
jgi:hypothetical protein